MTKTLLLLLLVAVANAKVFERCAWARTLKASGMDGYRGISLADWVCLTQHESHFNTRATNRNTDGSTDYGIFQINSKYWCRDGGVSRSNGCGINCSLLLETRSSRHGGSCGAVRLLYFDWTVAGNSVFGFRVAWTTHCQNRDLSSYLRGCRL
uniref:lysozyme n=1 Tax=Poecilia latipinna TaxID=48699 RepID=A0A3B3UV21_9TELE